MSTKMMNPYFHAIGRSAALVLAAALITSCQSVPPYTFDSVPSGEHVVGHAPGTCDLCDLYYDAQTYVVRIRLARGQAAGIVVSTAGEILTNAHVVQRADEPQIEIHNGEVFPAKVVRRSRRLDLALVEVEGPAARWVPLQLGRTSMPQVGSEVYVIGHPLGLGWTVTRGIVSAHRKPGEVARTAMIQTDAAISPGNSGGPLLDRNGDLVGLVVFKLSGGGAENVAFAIPASVIAGFLAEPGQPSQ
ncbi:MAG: trypsin-like peptidase domain-containing protein [Planctomycetes bacterium]|nr:trypsin-like peptidase domain-containing protein [Planctomycetota bacterium]